MAKRSGVTDEYLCVKCYRALPAISEKFRQCGLKLVTDEFRQACSVRSKISHANPDNRAKLVAGVRKVTATDEFKQKVSQSLKKKFKTDLEYVAKVTTARKNYKKKPVELRLSEFLKSAHNIHHGKYSYITSSYSTSKNKVSIVCPKHGIFSQRPGHHIHYGHGCPKCSKEITISKPQQEIAEWVKQCCGAEVICNDRTILPRNHEVDIYVPSFKLAIEYHGGFYHSHDISETAAGRSKHQRKAQEAVEAGISLLQFFEHEWLSSADVVKSIIANKLGKSSKLYARKCSIVPLNTDQARLFFNSNHLHGHVHASAYFGLMHRDSIVAAVSLTTRRGKWELTRFANVLNHTVVGGLSRLLSHAATVHKISKLYTFADRRLSPSADAYIKSGFIYLGTTRPGYHYWLNNKVFNRIKFQKHKLPGILKKYDPELTESQNMFSNGFRRVWDAGHHKLLKVFYQYENKIT